MAEFGCWIYQDHLSLQQYNAQRSTEFRALLLQHEQSVAYRQGLWMTERLEERSMRAGLIRQTNDSDSNGIALKAAEVQFHRAQFLMAFYAMAKDVYAEIRNAYDIISILLTKIGTV